MIKEFFENFDDTMQKKKRVGLKNISVDKFRRTLKKMIFDISSLIFLIYYWLEVFEKKFREIS